MDATNAAVAAFEAEFLQRIPLTDAMGLTLTRFTGTEVEMTAPLTPNVNDKGCAFGGSMASLLTLAGWALIELNLRTRGVECDIYVGDSHVRYHEPVWGKLRGVARFAEAGALDALLASLRERGKGRVEVACELAGERRAAATLVACFFAKSRA